MSKYPIRNVQRNMPGDDEGSPKRFIAADLEGVRIVNTYVPQGNKPGTDEFDSKLDWLSRLRQFLDKYRSRDSNLLLSGDFNVAPHEIDVWSPARCEGKIHFSRPERAALIDVMEWGFTNVYRMLNPAAREFSGGIRKQKRFRKTKVSASTIFGRPRSSLKDAAPLGSTKNLADGRDQATTRRSSQNSISHRNSCKPLNL